MGFIKKYIVLLFLIFLIIILIILKLVYKTDVSNEKLVITPTPTLIEKKQTETGLDLNTEYPLDPIIPYETEDFIIEKYSEPLVLKVKALNKDKVLVEKEIRAWIKENGMDPENHKIVWE